MASNERIRRNRDGKIFLPMNVEGGSEEQSFITATKMSTLVIIVVSSVFTLSLLADSKASLFGYVIVIGAMLFVYQLLTRYIIFEERYYYKVYRKMKMYDNPTPGIFWNISSIQDTDNGAIMTYADMKIGVMVRIERDTIVGKSESFKEMHFDALSEFYKELSMRGLKFIQMNIMEQAGKDSRIDNLDEIVNRSTNKNITSILEMQLGYIKSITRESLYESDYFIIYTDGNMTGESLVNDTIDCLYRLMDGAYTGFDILNSREIQDMPKDLYDVNYFDSAEASLNVYKHVGLAIDKAFDISEVSFEQGDSIEVGERGNLLIKNLTSYIENGTLKDGEWTIKEALNGKFNMNFNNGSIGIKEDTSEDSIAVGINTEADDFIIDLDNNAFGGEFGIGINSVKETNIPIVKEEQIKNKFNFRKKK